jgi:hypothetical protein
VCEQSERFPYARRSVPYGFLRAGAYLQGERSKGGDVTDLVLIAATVAFFGLSFALVKWFDRI